MTSRPLGFRILKNVAALLSGRAVSLLLSAAASIVLVRHLGSAQLGDYGAIYSFAMLFAWLASFGLEPILTREAARRTAEQADIVATGVWLGVRFSVLAAVLAMALGPLAGYRGAMAGLLLLAVVELLLLFPVRLPGLIFQVELRQWYTVGFGLLRQLVWLALLLVLAWAGATLAFVIAGRLLCAAGESLLIWRASRGRLPVSGRVLSGEIKRLLVQSLPVAFGVLAVSIYQRIDQVMLHNMVGSRELGYYVASVNLVEPLQMVPFALLSSLFPVLAQSAAEPARMERYLDLTFRVLAATSFGACVLFTLAGGPFVVLLYGSEFSASESLLAVLVWAQPAVFLATAVANVNMARNDQSYNLLATIAGAAMNVGLNLLLIPRLGALGAAGATVVSSVFAWIVVLLVPARTRPLILRGLRSFLPAAAVSAAATGGALFLLARGWAASAAVVALYILGLWAVGIIRRGDIGWAIGLLRKSASGEEATT